MNLLVLGGTRFFGRRAVEMLLERGHDVTVLSRGVTPLPWPRGTVEHLGCDRNVRGEPSRSLRGRDFDAVFDNSAMDGGAVREVLDVLPGLARYVLTSSGAVYQRPGSPALEELVHGVPSRPHHDPFGAMRLLSEDDAPFEINWLRGEVADEVPGYRRGKLEAELALAEAGPGSGPAPIVLRPPQIEGPRDPTGRTEFFARRVADGGGILLPAEGRGGVFQKVFSEDLAAAAVAAVESAPGIRGPFNVAGPEIMTMERYLYALALVLDLSPPRILYAPAEEIRNALGRSYAPPVPGSKVVDISRARAQLDFCPRRYVDRMRDTLEWIFDRAPAPGLAAAREREIDFLRSHPVPMAPPGDRQEDNRSRRK